MSNAAKKEYLLSIRSRYSRASRSEKRQILDEFCRVCDYNRKYALRVRNRESSGKSSHKAAKRGPKSRYDNPEIVEVLKYLWRLTNLPCSKRLKAIIHLWLPYYPYYLPDALEEALLSISPATIDRLMKPIRSRFNKLGLATTQPGSILKNHIPVKVGQWEESTPGYLEADTLAHCGSSAAGMFVYSINCLDIASSPEASGRAAWGKGETGVMAAIASIEESRPFPIVGFDCDNGSEFLNWHLYRHFSQRKQPIQFTRSRPYHKNDNAHIEEKNWSHLRQYLGYQRFDNPILVDLLNELYSSEWYLYFNFFMPSVKLLHKVRNSCKIIKKYDAPKTPFQRLLQSPAISEQTKKDLKQKFEELNPFILQKHMTEKIKHILNIAASSPEADLLRKSASGETIKTL